VTSSQKLFIQRNVGLLFAAPALLYMLVFVGYPIASNVSLSMHRVTVETVNAESHPFVGMENYFELFADPVLWISIRNTFVFTIGSIVFQLVFGFGLALFFHGGFFGSKPMRGLLMIPWMIPMTITGLMFKFMFASNVGIVNELLQLAGIIDEPVGWLLEPNLALFGVLLANIWIGIPFNMVLLATGLTAIPQNLYENASIDGAGKVSCFLHITLPLLRPAIESVLMLGLIYTFKVFDLVYVMTRGGPVNATQLMSTYSYKLSFTLFRYSDGAAVANILFVILAAFGAVYLVLVRGERNAQ
jgi:multiple sugar transport system permease protein